MPRPILALVAVLTLPTVALPANPTLTTITPRGGQRGSDVRLTFTGANLADAQDVLAHDTGIAVKRLTVASPTAVHVDVTIAADCRLGAHAFRVRTATGVSPLRTFWVGALPCVDEVEPNDTFERPQPVALNTTVHGTITGEDVDHFAVACKKGQRLSVEVEGMRLGDTFWDPHVAVLDARRFELAANDDSPLLGQDAGCSVVVPADGTYVVQLRDASYGGGPAARYRLHVGTFPRPTGIVPAGGRPGDKLDVRFVGDPLGEIRAKVTLPTEPSPHWRVHCETADGVSPTGFPFRVTDLPGVTSPGTNTTPATAVRGPAPAAYHGVLAKAGDAHYFTFPALKGATYEVRVFARRLGSPLDPVVHVGVTGGGEIAGNDDSDGGPDSRVRFTPTESRDHTVWVHDHLKKGGADDFYRVEVDHLPPSVSLSLQRADLANPLVQERQAVAVPRGGRFAALVVADRHDCGGPLAVRLDRLPLGVTQTADAMDPAQGLVPVVWEARPDAPVGGFLAALVARHGDPAVQIGSDTRQDVALVTGPGQATYARYAADRVPVAVTAGCPYRVDVIEPKVPLVQGGSYDLRVVCKRDAGFTGPINVHPLWQPPGVGISAVATIPAGATECVLPMNAAPNAAPRMWRTALLAVATVGDGPVWTSSQLFAVEVARPLVALTLERPAVEVGGTATVFGKLTVVTPFDGKATATLLGLPGKVTATDIAFTKDATEVSFPLTAAAGSPVGRHGGVFVRVVLMRNGEAIVQSAGATELRVDAPLPPKTSTPPPATATRPTPAPPKRLTRLEQLRLEQVERERAAGGTK